MGAQATLPITKWLHSSLGMGLFVDSRGPKLSARDAQLGFPLLVVNKPAVQFRVTPGISLPLGAATSGLEYTLLTTGSFDPTLGVGFSAGSAWMVLASASGRLPLHPGFDRVQQGLFTTANLLGARRVGGGGVSVGVSMASQIRRGFSSPGFVEIAPTVGASIPVGDAWGLGLGLRVPVWSNPGPPPYLFALRVGLTRIVKLPGSEKKAR